MVRGKHSKQNKSRGFLIPLVAVLLIAVAAVFIFHNRHESASPTPEAELAVPSPAVQTPDAVVPTPALSVQDTPAGKPDDTPAPVATVEAEVSPEPVTATEPPAPEHATEPVNRAITWETYGYINDIVYTYKTRGEEGNSLIDDLLEKLKAANPPLGETWQCIMDAWHYCNTSFVPTPNLLPDGLPDDDSLCIIVLGYQLYSDGGMTPELTGRCETALKNAVKYPNAYIAVTGGGTALYSSATEAGVMRDWLVEHGVDENRIIVEDRSTTTGENAIYTMNILRSLYPQIGNLAVVTSDYHAGMGCLLFETAALIHAYEEDSEPLRVCADACYMTGVTEMYGGLALQGQYIWSIADPKY